jgi:hypothetical protein
MDATGAVVVEFWTIVASLKRRLVASCSSYLRAPRAGAQANAGISA